MVASSGFRLASDCGVDGAGHSRNCGQEALPSCCIGGLDDSLSYYLSGAQSWMAFAGPTILVTLLAGAYAVKRGLLWVAWCLLSMFAGTALGLAVIVLRG